MPTLAAGDMAPGFDLETDAGDRARLADFRGRPAVIYFYPSDGSETCTAEALAFSAAAHEFANAGAIVVGISPDPPASHHRFKSRHALNLVLASDPDHKVIGLYGLWTEKTMFGRRYMGVERATFLIDPTGRIADVWHKVRIKGHVAAVLASLAAL